MCIVDLWFVPVSTHPLNKGHTNLGRFVVTQKTKRQEQLAKRQIEIQKEAEQKKKEESDRRFQERRGGANNLDSEKAKQTEGNDNSRASTPATSR